MHNEFRMKSKCITVKCIIERVMKSIKDMNGTYVEGEETVLSSGGGKYERYWDDLRAHN